jgi:hypothetical protein
MNAGTPKIIVSANARSEPRPDNIQGVGIEPVEPSLLSEGQAANWASHLLEQDDVPLTDFSKWSAPIFAETRLYRFRPGQHEGQERLCENC